MKLPKSVNIFGMKFKVKLQPLNGYLGLCDRTTKTIYVESNQTNKEIMATLIHEIGHAVFSRISLVQAISPELEEIIVDSLAVALVENFEIK